MSIDIQRGEIVSIVGSSGAGKSTLLHILGTLDKADMGWVSLEGTEINSLSAKKLADFRNKKIGFVFQFHHLLPEFSALENVCIPGWLAGRKKKEVEEKKEEDPEADTKATEEATNKEVEENKGEEAKNIETI